MFQNYEWECAIIIGHDLVLLPSNWADTFEGLTATRDSTVLSDPRAIPTRSFPKFQQIYKVESERWKVNNVFFIQLQPVIRAIFT